jgi:hypothetical protein
LRKQEAVALINEIMESCMFPRYIALEATNPKDTVEKRNYELKLRNHFDAPTWNCLREIVRKRNLSMKETGDYIIVYSVRENDASSLDHQ